MVRGEGGTRLPELGPHGEGWTVLQLLLYAWVAAAGRAGPRWGARASRILRPVAGALGVGSAALMTSGAVALGRAMTPNPRPRAAAGVRDRGPYALVRHPVYGGVILGLLAWLLWSGPGAAPPSLLTGLFLDLKSRREEAWLEERYPSYRDYRVRVRRRFLPLVW